MIKLYEEALKARDNSYSPYSNFKVGAALLTEDGTIITGNNVENALPSVSCCAEQVAIYKAISEGHRKFTKICIVGNNETSECFPCGVCRQVMSEFCCDDFIIITNKDGVLTEYTLKQLLPYAFKLEGE